MTKENFSFRANLRYDLPAALVVVLVALPLCLGIALASGAPLASGLIAGIVGGIVIGALSKSPLSVSGPAAGLTVIVLAAIQSLPSFEAFLLAVCIAGVIQIGLGIIRAGLIGDFIPSSVIKGMLAAIGIILILKQIPHAVGYDADYVGDESFQQADETNTLSSLWHMLSHISAGAAIISAVSIAFLFWWDKKQPKMKNGLRYVPGPLVVVLFGVAANAVFQSFYPEFAIHPEHLVSVPVASSPSEFFSMFRLPDFSMITHEGVWITAFTLALVASVETLLSIEAIDKLDTFKRITPTNRELVAQGVGNITSGFLGGLPVTSVIVRSSANANAGARTKISTIVHGAMLLVCVAAIPSLLNLIPLSALAAVLIATGYKLAKPSLFRDKYVKGYSHLVPFVVTIAAILFTDLLVGIMIGVAVGAIYMMIENYRSAIMVMSDTNSNYLVRFKKDLFFIHKYELKKRLSEIPESTNVVIDFTRVNFIDLDNVEIINDFITSAKFKDITVKTKNNVEGGLGNVSKVMYNEAV